MKVNDDHLFWAYSEGPRKFPDMGPHRAGLRQVEKEVVSQLELEPLERLKVFYRAIKRVEDCQKAIEEVEEYLRRIGEL